ncbi:erythromycin biosynthesis sensory transduction protein eryC1, partial [Methylobacterium radiotolerans]
MIPFLDLKAQYAAIGGDVETAVLNVLAAALRPRPGVSAFEAASPRCGARP